MTGRILSIAGSDPSGGAGIQADIKTITALGGYAMTAITALTVQNTTGVASIHPIDPNIISDQINSVLDDIGADAIKIGMIGDNAAADAIADALTPYADTVPIVLDPVLVATSGDQLAADGVVGALKRRLMPISRIVTPNAPEAAALSGKTIATPDDARSAGADLRTTHGPGAVLVKGGHLDDDCITDMLITADGAKSFRAPRLVSSSTHGTGCTLAAAIATGLAQGQSLELAVTRAIQFVRAAIETAPGYGAGHGPLNHMHAIPAFSPETPA